MTDRQERWYRSGIQMALAMKLGQPAIAHLINEAAIDEVMGKAAEAAGTGRLTADQAVQRYLDELDGGLGIPHRWIVDVICGGNG